VRGFLGQQRENEQLQIISAELPPRAEAMPSDVAAIKGAIEEGAEATPVTVAACAPVRPADEHTECSSHHRPLYH
jgi:hypothetical protein